jgi:hypothetical protein
MAGGGSHIFDLDVQAFVDAFDQRPVGVRHALADHPLLQLDAIAELAERFPGHIERHRANLPLVVPGGAPELEGSPSETVRRIETNGCWMVFWYIEQDREYKALLDACLDEAESYLPRQIGRTRQREAFLFLSAPNAVTPVHFDPEHNFLLQIRGRKNMTVCPFPDPGSEQRELERYHDGGHRNLEAVPSEGENFSLEPGAGVYVPSFMPHWVQNAPKASVSLSITFRSRSSLRAERVHSVNARLRRLKLSPPPPGTSAVRDRAKASLYVAMRGWRGPVARLRRAVTGVPDDSADS